MNDVRLIDADALGLDINRKANENFPANRNLTLYAESLLAHAQTIDAVPVVHGRWISVRGEASGMNWKCSKCCKRVIPKYLYCPNCGARMDGDDNVL